MFVSDRAKPVAQLGDPQLRVQHARSEAVLPPQRRRVASRGRRNLDQCVLGVTLDASNDRAADAHLNGLKPHVVVRQLDARRRQFDDAVAVHGDRFENGRLVAEHRMDAPGLRQADAPCETELATERVRDHAAVAGVTAARSNLLRARDCRVAVDHENAPYGTSA